MTLIVGNTRETLAKFLGADRMLDLKAAIPKLRHWVEKNPHIDRIWIFGSYARGTADEYSDLDIAVDVVIPPDQAGKESAIDLYCRKSDTWMEELKQLLGFWYVRIGYLDRKAFPIVSRGMKDGRLLVYSRREPE